MIRTLPLVALLGIGPSLSAQQLPAYHPLILDCSRYRQAVHTTIELQSTGQRSRELTERDGVLQLHASARDSLIALEAWFDTLALSREGAGERLIPDTDALIGGRFLGLLTPRGGLTLSDTPFVPDDVAQVAEVSDALTELLPALPPIPLAPGAGWHDAFGTTILRLEDGREAGRVVARYRLSRRLEREESRTLSDSSVVRAMRRESETGTFDWSVEEGLVRWERNITVQVEVPAEGVVARPFRTRIEQRITIVRQPPSGSCR